MNGNVEEMITEFSGSEEGIGLIFQSLEEKAGVLSEMGIDTSELNIAIKNLREKQAIFKEEKESGQTEKLTKTLEQLKDSIRFEIDDGRNLEISGIDHGDFKHALESLRELNKTLEEGEISWRLPKKEELEKIESEVRGKLRAGIDRAGIEGEVNSSEFFDVMINGRLIPGGHYWCAPSSKIEGSHIREEEKVQAWVIGLQGSEGYPTEIIATGKDSWAIFVRDIRELEDYQI